MSDTSASTNKKHSKLLFRAGVKLVPPADVLALKEVSSPETADLATEVITSLPEPAGSPTWVTTEEDISIYETIPQAALSGDEGIASQDVSLLETVPRTPIPAAPSFRPGIRRVGSARRRVKKGKARRLDKKKKTILIMLLVGLLIPSLITVVYGINLFLMFRHAIRGVSHLQNVQAMFSDAKSHPAELLDPNKLLPAKKQLIAAYADFRSLHDMLDSDALISAVSTILPQFDPQIASARSLSQVGADVSEVGEEVATAMLSLAPSFRAALANARKPLVTPAMLNLIGGTLEEILPRINDIQAQTQTLSLDVLPISAQQRDELLRLIQVMPQVQTYLTQIHPLLNAIGWALGVDAPRTFLVQTMDRAELRPAGGFTGQFGELLTNGGRVTPPSLKNIGPYEEDNPTSPVNGQLAPEPFRSWWPLPNWGLRDANLSADFPTTAQLVMGEYQFEFKHQVDGVIVFTPFLIEHMLQIIGPISIPSYHETITALNLEERLHYYQLDNTGIRKEEIVEHVEDPVAARKLFTARLASLLASKVIHVPPGELLAIGNELLYDLQTRDLQVYVTNQQLEELLVRNGDAAQIDRSTTHDGLYVVQANLSASKASQYVQTIIHDTVTLNAAGGATHVMQLRLVYTQAGPVYGLDTYRDYVRVYVPPGSMFLWGDGFDTGIPFCGARYGACPPYDAYGNGDLMCPAGQFEPGAATGMLNDPYAGRNHPLDTVGPPANFTSDEPGRAMFGGWVVVPKNCVMTVSLSWYVPPMGHGPYTLLFQRQAATFPVLDLTILPTPGDCVALKTQGEHFEGVLSGADRSFSVNALDPKIQNGASCYPRPGI